MRIVIVYVSTHHGNTKKLVDAIAESTDVTLINAIENKSVDLTEYDCIGFASGVAFGKYYPRMLEFMEKNLPENKKVFFIHTSGDPKENHNTEAKKISDRRGCDCVGTYFCRGFDTFGPFKLIGGIAKGHPNSEDIKGAVEFFDRISK